MKRIAFAAAAALLGTACISSSSPPPPPPPPSGAVDISWSFLRWKTDGATLTYGCDQAGVDNVIVSFQMDGDVQVGCRDAAGDGALIGGLTPGTQSFTITGRRGGVALFSSAAVTLSVANGQTTSAGSVQANGIPDDLDVYANFRGQYGADMLWRYCADANVQTLEYALADWANNVIATGSVACTDPAGLSFTGAYALDRDNYVIRLQAFRTGIAAPIFDSASVVAPAGAVCNGQAFDHFGNDIGSAAWDVTLYDVTNNGGSYCG